MKKFSLIMTFVATLVLGSCSMMQSVAGSDSVAKASGQAAGTAVQGLFSAYNSTGTIDLTNANNLNNALALATSYTALKENKDNTAYRKAFTNGLIASSAGLITSGNAAAFIDRLLASAGLGNITTQGITQTAQTAAAVIALLNVLKQ